MEQDLRERIRREIYLLSKKQEALAEEREQVLLERSAFQSKCKRTKRQRNRTGDAEVAFMNAVREFYIAQGAIIPPTITAAYDSVQAEREKLSTIEADYFQTEETLGGKEWEFHKKENELYQYHIQQLISDDTLHGVGLPAVTKHQPSTALESEPDVLHSLARYQTVTAKHDFLIKQFDALRHGQAEILFERGSLDLRTPYAEGQMPLETYDYVLTEQRDCEVQSENLRQKLMQYTIPAEKILFPRTMEVPMPITHRFLLDGEYPNHLTGIPASHRLHEWLLSSLQASPLERIQHSNVLQDELEYLGAAVSQYNYEFWEDWMASLWFSDIDLQSPNTDMQSMTSQNSQHPQAI